MLSVEEIKSYQRSCLVNFMKKNKLNSGLWSKKAGISGGHNQTLFERQELLYNNS